MSTERKQLRYPTELANTDNSDYLQFGFYKYYPAYRKSGKSSNRVDNYNQTTGANTWENKGTSSFWEGGNSEASKQKRIAQKMNSPAGNFGRQQGPDIFLYMPPDVSTSFAADWGGKEINNATAGGLAASSNIQAGDLGGLMDNVLSGLTSLGALPQSTAARLTKAAASAAGSSLNINDVLAGTTGVMLNPNVEVLFGGPKLRNVSFAFKMSARNEEEAEVIHNICTEFKKHSLPQLGGASMLLDSFASIATGVEGVFDKSKMTGDYGNFIEVPDLVMLKYMKGSKMHPYLSQYKSCALTNVDINYTPDGVYSTFIGGYPTAVELRIGLVETKLVYKQEIGPQVKNSGAKGNNENVGRTWSY